MKIGQQEEELISVKLRSLHNEANMQLSLKKESQTKWLVRVGLANTLTNVPRYEQLETILKIIKSNEQIYTKIFGSDDSVNQLLDNCKQLYDIAFVIQNHLSSKNAQLSVAVLNKLQKKFLQFFNANCDQEPQLYLQGIRMFISLSQSSTKEPAATFITPIYLRQRKQCAKVYQWVFKPLFEKKNLKTLYIKLVGLVNWIMLMESSQTFLINDLSKKLNSFLLYYKNEDSIEMISVCNTLFDLLSVRFPRQSNLTHYALASLLVKLRNCRLQFFFEVWLQARSAFISTIDFQFMLKTLSQMGCGSIILDILTKIWAYMRRTSRYNVLLNIFSGYIRKEYLRLWMERAEDLTRYVRIAKYFMVGLCNRQRFQGQQIDEITNNLCKHSVNRGISLVAVSNEVLQFYSLYQNRFSFLSQTSKRFLTETKQRTSKNIQTAAIHALFEQLTIRQLSPEEQEYWHKGKVSYRYRGLQNLGNTCYLNSFMQALFMTKKFRGLIYQLTQDGQLPSKHLKTYALQNLFEQLAKKQLQLQSPFRPEYFRVELTPPFNTTTHQQDAAEFGRIYLEQLDKELGSSVGGLQKLLVQRLQKTIRCVKCGTEKKNDQKVFDLILSVERNQLQLYLSKLLQRYFKPEQFTDDNKVFCSKCDKKEIAVSELVPLKFSEVVVLTINLFDYIGEGRKILTPLIFQFSLNFEALLNHKQMGEYQLYAFIVHLGSNPSSGHYVCYARNLQQNPMVWYCMDDGYVTQKQISKPEQFGFGENETPYMLFYSRKATGRNKV